VYILPILKKALICTKRSKSFLSSPIVNIGTIFHPIPSFFLVIETANEPSPSVKPVTNQGLKLKPSIFFLKKKIDLTLLRFSVLSFAVDEYKRLFKICIFSVTQRSTKRDPDKVILSNLLRVHLKLLNA